MRIIAEKRRTEKGCRTKGFEDICLHFSLVRRPFLWPERMRMRPGNSLRTQIAGLRPGRFRNLFVRADYGAVKFGDAQLLQDVRIRVIENFRFPDMKLLFRYPVRTPASVSVFNPAGSPRPLPSWSGTPRSAGRSRSPDARRSPCSFPFPGSRRSSRGHRP